MGNGILDIAVTGLATAQNQLLTASHNISNAGTPGFNRQQVLLSTNTPQSGGAGFIGRGVHSSTVQRIVARFHSMDQRMSQIRKAANLLRFQQAYQASSKIIEMSSTLFDSILRFG